MFAGFKERVIHQYASVIRERAIGRAKARIALSGRRPAELSEDELDVIVKEEEDTIKRRIYGSGIAAIMVVLGVN